MENGDALYARIAELEKEYDILRGKYSDLWHYGMNDDLSEGHIVEMLLRKGEKDRVMEVWSDVYEDMRIVRTSDSEDEGTDDEDEEEQEEVLEDLTCAQLKTRLRAINKPVGGRKADLIQRIREHERLTAALFEED